MQCSILASVRRLVLITFGLISPADSLETVNDRSLPGGDKAQVAFAQDEPAPK